MRIVNSILNFVNSIPTPELLNQTHLLKITSSQLTTASAVNSSSDELSIDAQVILDTQLLYKSYFSFLLNIINADLMNIIIEQTSQDVYKIFYTLLDGGQNGSLETVKISFQIIRKFITVFGNFEFFLNFKIILKNFESFFIYS